MIEQKWLNTPLALFGGHLEIWASFTVSEIDSGLACHELFSNLTYTYAAGYCFVIRSKSGGNDRRNQGSTFVAGWFVS